MGTRKGPSASPNSLITHSGLHLMFLSEYSRPLRLQERNSVARENSTTKKPFSLLRFSYFVARLLPAEVFWPWSFSQSCSRCENSKLWGWKGLCQRWRVCALPLKPKILGRGCHPLADILACFQLTGTVSPSASKVPGVQSLQPGYTCVYPATSAMCVVIWDSGIFSPGFNHSSS